MVQDSLLNTISTLQNNILDMHADGFHASMFMKLRKLHLTIAVMKLDTPEATAKAIQVLRDAKEACKQLTNGPFDVHLKGLQTMEGNLNQARVLYAAVDKNHDGYAKMNLIHQHLLDLYEKSGLLQLEKRPMVWHMTVANAKYAKHIPHAQRRFQATNLLNAFQQHEFGLQPVQSISLYRMFGGDGSVYPVEAAITLD
jgi:2'-5' RNA ligase